jgi:hypothetical protein
MPKSTRVMSLTDIRSLIESYRDRAAVLRARLAQIEAHVGTVESTLAALTGGSVEATGTRGAADRRPSATLTPAAPRPSRGTTHRPPGQDLASVIHKVLLGAPKPMRLPEIVSAVKKGGYASSSPSFARIVGMRLGDRKRFRRVGRGVYTAAQKG